MVAYDAVVVGLGAMGSAAAFHLAARGARVLGLDRFAPPHALGSTHGESRIIREAYFEDPRYVPLVQRAYLLWRELEKQAGEPLLLETGGLMIGREDGVLVRGAIASGDTHRLPYQRMSAAEVRRRFPALEPADDLMAIWEPRAGVLYPEACVRAHLGLAARAGAELRVDTPALEWGADGVGFWVATPNGRVGCSRLVLAANAWLGRLLPGVRLPITVARQPLFWFEPKQGAPDFEPDRLPIYLWEPEPDQFFYGFPALGGRVKVAPHGGGSVTDPDSPDRAVSDSEVAAMRARLDRHMPRASGRFARAVVCLYANTPDGHFAIGPHPEHPGAIVLSACSGHGFKFSSAIGEVAADLALEGRSRFDLEPFSLARFG